MKRNIAGCEEEFLKLFCKKYKFSEYLYKYEDKEIYDMYDHNFFVYNDKTTIAELEKAIQYQKTQKLDYFKLIADKKISRKILNQIGLKESCTLTMLHDNKTDRFKINDRVAIKTVTLQDLNAIEIKHYGKLYGEAFLRRRNKCFLSKAKENDNFNYYGAYINNKIAGVCYAYTYRDYTCLDSLLVDKRYRHKYVASTLIKYVKDSSEFLFLHADNDDTPKKMYMKFGFKQLSKKYEYYKKL